jgi:glucokinase
MGDGASSTPLRLVGDIGGTNARFALAEPTSGRPRLSAFKSLRCEDYASLEEAIAAYFAGQPHEARPTTAVIAVAGPVIDGAINFTNLGWRVSEPELERVLGFRSATLINDYAALALAAPALSDEDVHYVGERFAGRADSTIAMIGAGTGFGASALVRDGRTEAVLTTEGGHIAYAPTDALEAEIWRILSLKFGRVSVERVLSGPGLLNLHGAMLELEGSKQGCETPDSVSRLADEGDPLALRTVQLFCDILGSVAGDFALVYGAQGGMCIAGGVAPRLLAHLEKSDFRRRFEAKGRFESYLRAIPSMIVTQPYAALLGAGRAPVGVMRR